MKFSIELFEECIKFTDTNGEEFIISNDMINTPLNLFLIAIGNAVRLQEIRNQADLKNEIDELTKAFPKIS